MVKFVKIFIVAMLLLLSVSSSFAFSSKIEKDVTEKDIIIGTKDNKFKQEFIDDFSILSEKEKDKFLEYINNPELIFNGLKNGDKNIERIKTVKNEILSGASFRSRTLFNKATYRESVKIFGVEIVGVNGWVRYAHDGKKVLYVENGNVNVINNLPFTTTSLAGETKRVDGDKAYYMTDIQFHMVNKYIPGSNFSTVDFGVWGDTSGNQGGWAHVQ